MRIPIAAHEWLEIIHTNQQHIRLSVFRSNARENREAKHKQSSRNACKMVHATNTSDAAQKVII